MAHERRVLVVYGFFCGRMVNSPLPSDIPFHRSSVRQHRQYDSLYAVGV